jgi:hypothetical protein
MQTKHVKPFGTKNLLKEIEGDVEFVNVVGGQLDVGVNETNNKTKSYGQEIRNSRDDSKGNLNQHALLGKGLDLVQQPNAFEVTPTRKRKHERCSLSGDGSEKSLVNKQTKFLAWDVDDQSKGSIKGHDEGQHSMKNIKNIEVGKVCGESSRSKLVG